MHVYFKNHFNKIAHALSNEFNGNRYNNQNPADIGEIAETLTKKYLSEAFPDHFRIHRGGKIVNSNGDMSGQLDVLLCNKNSIKLFDDKGLYPIETVSAAISVTSNLDNSKLIECVKQFANIPKHHYHFTIEKYYGSDFISQTHEVFKHFIPCLIIFAFDGNISENSIQYLNDETRKIEDHSLWPTFIVVNKKFYIELIVQKNAKGEIERFYEYQNLTDFDYPGFPFSKISSHLYNFSGEQYILKPDYAPYFVRDLWQ